MAQVNFRIDDNVKQDADKLFDNLGVSLSAAITIFLKKSISRRGFPFPLVEEQENRSAEFYPYEKAACLPVVDERVARQKAAMMKFAGSWKDNRSTDEIIHDIESHRTKGREVNL